MQHLLWRVRAFLHALTLRAVSGLHRKLDPGAFFSRDASLEIDLLTVENERLKAKLQGSKAYRELLERSL